MNEAFANQLRRVSAQMDPENRDHLMLMSSQLLGVVAAAAVAGDDANSLQTGSYVAGNATQYNNLNHHDMSDFVGDMDACGNNEICQKKTWEGGKYDQISNEITDWSEKAVSGAFAKSLLTSIQGGLTALNDLNCTTATCTQYKDTLTERALNDLTNLAKVTDTWENATSVAALVIPTSGGARGAGVGEGGISPRVQAALDKFTEAKAIRTGATLTAEKTALPAGYREGNSVGAAFNERGGLPEGYRRVINTKTGNTEVLAADGKLYLETSNGLTPKAGGNLAGLVDAEKNIAGAKGISITIEPKIADQMGKRGWTESSIQSVIDKPIKTVVTKDTRFDTVSGSRLNDPATGYIAKDGSYVVRNDRTGAIVQVSNKNDPGWVAPWD